jgi:hypothetical protein
MHKVLLSVLLSAVLIAAGSSSAWALQSGGVAYGDLETGRVSGINFNTLDVDLEYTIMEIGGKKVIYPPTSILNLVTGGTAGRGAFRPVLIKVTNNTKAEHGFDLSADSKYAAPTSMHVKTVVKPGETKYIGIPISDLTYVTANSLLKYKCQIHGAHLGGTLLILTK